MKNGELVESQNGHLIVTHNITLNNNQEHVDSDTPLDLSMKSGFKHYDTDSVFFSSPQSNLDDTREMNLVRKVPNIGLVKTEQVDKSDISSKIANMTKLLPRIAPKPSPGKVVAPKPSPVKAIQPKDEVLGEETKVQPIVETAPETIDNDDIKKLFPLLKTTNTGSMVLWNFLWALLQDDNYNNILR